MIHGCLALGTHQLWLSKSRIRKNKYDKFVTVQLNPGLIQISCRNSLNSVLLPSCSSFSTPLKIKIRVSFCILYGWSDPQRLWLRIVWSSFSAEEAKDNQLKFGTAIRILSDLFLFVKKIPIELLQTTRSWVNYSNHLSFPYLLEKELGYFFAKFGFRQATLWNLNGFNRCYRKIIRKSPN